MPSLVTGSEYLIYWIGMGVCLIIGLISALISWFRQRRRR
jgi:cytochrome oxidase assembly protein ShyY1